MTSVCPSSKPRHRHASQACSSNTCQHTQRPHKPTLPRQHTTTHCQPQQPHHVTPQSTPQWHPGLWSACTHTACSHQDMQHGVQSAGSTSMPSCQRNTSARVNSAEAVPAQSNTLWLEWFNGIASLRKQPQNKVMSASSLRQDHDNGSATAVQLQPGTNSCHGSSNDSHCQQHREAGLQNGHKVHHPQPACDRRLYCSKHSSPTNTPRAPRTGGTRQVRPRQPTP